MLDIFLTPHSLPFAISIAVVLLLFILEILSAVMGASILGMGGDGIGIDAEFDMDADFDFSAKAGIDAADVQADMTHGPSGLMSWLGISGVPFLIWMVSFLTMFGLFGLLLQGVVFNIIGTPLYASLASLIVLIPALFVAKVISNWVALLMPKTETSAMRMRFLGGHRGIITQGTAARNKPAEAKIKDRHGNIHYLRVEPLDDTETFAMGEDVTIIRKRGDKFFVI